MAGWLDKILWCYHSNETSFADLLNGAIWSLQKEDWRMWIFYIGLSLESGWEWKGWYNDVFGSKPSLVIPIYRVCSLITIVQASSQTTSTVPGPSKGVNKAYLEQALGSILQKRGFSAVYSDQCFLHLDELRRSCDNYNSTFTKRDCLVSCGK